MMATISSMNRTGMICDRESERAPPLRDHSIGSAADGCETKAARCEKKVPPVEVTVKSDGCSSSSTHEKACSNYDDEEETRERSVTKNGPDNIGYKMAHSATGWYPRDASITDRLHLVENNEVLLQNRDFAENDGIRIAPVEKSLNGFIGSNELLAPGASGETSQQQSAFYKDLLCDITNMSSNGRANDAGSLLPSFLPEEVVTTAAPPRSGDDVSGSKCDTYKNRSGGERAIGAKLVCLYADDDLIASPITRCACGCDCRVDLTDDTAAESRMLSHQTCGDAASSSSVVRQKKSSLPTLPEEAVNWRGMNRFYSTSSLQYCTSVRMTPQSSTQDALSLPEDEGAWMLGELAASYGFNDLTPSCFGSDKSSTKCLGSCRSEDATKSTTSSRSTNSAGGGSSNCCCRGKGAAVLVTELVSPPLETRKGPHHSSLNPLERIDSDDDSSSLYELVQSPSISSSSSSHEPQYQQKAASSSSVSSNHHDGTSVPLDYLKTIPTDELSLFTIDAFLVPLSLLETVKLSEEVSLDNEFEFMIPTKEDPIIEESFVSIPIEIHRIENHSNTSPPIRLYGTATGSLQFLAIISQTGDHQKTMVDFRYSSGDGLIFSYGINLFRANLLSLL